MCLAIAGKILAIGDQAPQAGREAAEQVGLEAGAAIGGTLRGDLDGDPLWRVAEVDFGGVRQQVSLACLPQARVGDRVLVHVGFALALVDEDDDAPAPDQGGG